MYFAPLTSEATIQLGLLSFVNVTQGDGERESILLLIVEVANANLEINHYFGGKANVIPTRMSQSIISTSLATFHNEVF